MRRRVVPSALLLALTLALGLALGRAGAQEASPDLSGEWQASGWNLGVDPAGEPSYRGKVTLERRDHDTYLITWTIGERQNRGVGLYDPRTRAFAAGYVVGQGPGVAIWTVAADGKAMDCVGTFQARVGEVAHEAWRR